LRCHKIARACHVTSQWGFTIQANIKCLFEAEICRNSACSNSCLVNKKYSSIERIQTVLETTGKGIPNVGVGRAQRDYIPGLDAVTTRSKRAAYPPSSLTSSTHKQGILDLSPEDKSPWPGSIAVVSILVHCQPRFDTACPTD
jgi:hypothetical protein